MLVAEDQTTGSVSTEEWEEGEEKVKKNKRTKFSSLKLRIIRYNVNRARCRSSASVYNKYISSFGHLRS